MPRDPDVSRPPAPAPPIRLPAGLGLLAGLLMGAADSVPGVSGGTIALILGIYERFIRSISRVLRAPALLRDRTGRGQLAEALRFLLPLVLGVAAAYYLGTKLLVGPKDAPGLLRRADTGPLCFAFFFGLVLASLREPWRRIRERRWSHGAVALVAAVAAGGAAWYAGQPHAAAEPPRWALLYGGAAAVSVMLLPGVSGALLLVVIGQYTMVFGALHDRDLGVLGVFAVGVMLGLATFVPLLRHLLRRHHDTTMAALTGLMAGALWALWPWKEAYDPRALANTAPSGAVAAVLLAALSGAAAAWALARLERRMSPPQESP